MERRKFLCCCLAGIGTALLNSGSGATLTAQEQSVMVGAVRDYSAAGVYAKYLAAGFLLIVRDNELYALSAKCSHKGAPLTLSEETLAGRLFCTLHNGSFDLTGAPQGGPPIRALARCKIELQPDGTVVVFPHLQYGHQSAEWHQAKIKLASGLGVKGS